MRRFLTAIFLILSVDTAMAQHLRVTDNDGNPLSGIEVDNGTSGITDADGIVNLTVNSYPVTIRINNPFFEPVIYKVKSERLVHISLIRRKGTMQETVVTGVARPMALQNALSRYTIIDRAAIDEIGAVTLADALTTQLNINMQADAVLGTSISAQGLSSDKVKILIDGMPVNGRENGNVDLGQLNLNNVARIEIVKGPLSTVYGSDAIGGVINLISRKRSNAWDADVTLNYETIGKYNLNASASRHWGRHQITIGGGRNYFSGWGNQDTIAIHRVLLFKPKEQYLANAGYIYTAPHSGFTAQLASDYLWEKVTNKGSLANYPYNAQAIDQYFTTQRSNTRLALEKKIGKTGNLKLQNSYAYYKRNRKDVVKDLTTLNEILSTAQGAQDTSVFRDVNLRSNYSNQWKKLSYDAGYDIWLQFAQSQKFGHNEEHQQHDYALYGNASMNFLKDKLTTQIGLRSSYNTVYNAPVTYSLNALYHAAERVQLRASYAHSFRAPSLKEEYLEFIDQNHHIIGNPNLTAENGNTVQASGSWQYKAGKVNGQFVLTGSYNDIDNMITLSQADTQKNSLNYTYSNIAHIRNLVLNFQGDINRENIYLNAGVSLTHTFKEVGAFDAFDCFEATLNARYLIKAPKVNISLFYKYTGVTRNASAVATNNDLFGATLQPFHMVNLSAERYFLNNHIQAIIGIKNLLNTQTSSVGTSSSVHGDGGGIGLLPRSLFTTLRFSLN